MEEEQEEKIPRKWVVKPVVLPPIIFVLKKVWKANQVKLKTAGVFNFLCWVQMVTRVAFTDWVAQVLETYSEEAGTAKVNGRVIEFSAQTIGRFLKLPADGVTEGQLHKISKKQHDNIFEGEYPRNTKMWPIEKARQHWRPWFKFINTYLLFRPHMDTMAQRHVVAATQTWEGRRTNWAKIVQQEMRAELVKVRRGVPRPVDLYSVFYISVCCQELPRPVTPTSSPTTSTGTSPESGKKSKSLVAENWRLKLQLDAT